MQDNNHYLRSLFTKYREGRCTPMEVRELFNAMKDTDAHSLLEEALRKEFDAQLEDRRQEERQPGKVTPLFTLRKISIAAAVVVVIVWGGYFFLNTGKPTDAEGAIVAHKDSIQPGYNQAILTLGNGKKIMLDATAAGNIATLSGTIISLDDEGKLIYDAGETDKNGEVSFNTVSTPTGGFFKIVLPDGSKVWLNSESALTFPTRFRNGQRKVTLKGEGYFEIAKNEKKPFTVKVGEGEEINVLGTVFNIMSYANEPHHKITLLEGSIRLSYANDQIILKPGEQAILTDEKMEIKQHISVTHEIAWKNGLFDFQDDGLSHILRQLERWYNVDIIYTASGKEGHYSGAIRKSSSINEVLRMLELAGNVQFSIIGNKIIVNENN